MRSTLALVGLFFAVLTVVGWYYEEKWCQKMRSKVDTLSGSGCIRAGLMCIFWFCSNMVCIMGTVIFGGAAIFGYVN